MSLTATVQPSGSEQHINASSPSDANHSVRPWLFSPRRYLPPKRLAELSIQLNRSSSEHRSRKAVDKPERPALPVSLLRTVSAESQRQINTWTPSNSPCLAPTGMQTSSELSLSSSFSRPANACSIHSLEDRMNGIGEANRGRPHAIALYDFETQVEGDLQLRYGDLVMLEDVVDENWYRGSSVRTGQTGIFPMNHVEVRIPVTSGLYTAAQPKPRLIRSSLSKHEVNTSGSLNGSSPSARRDGTHLKSANHVHPLAVSTSVSASPARDIGLSHCTQSKLPRRPSRVRVASLNSKHDFLRESLERSMKLPKNNSASELHRPVNLQRMFSPPRLTTAVPTRAQTSFGPDLSKPDRERNAPVHVNRSATPTIIQALRPKCQNSVSQLAQSLEQRGVAITRMSHLPAGAKPLFPASFKLPVVDKIRNHEEVIDATSETTNSPQRFPTPSMVETPLVKLVRDKSNRQNGGENCLKNGANIHTVSQENCTQFTNSHRVVDDAPIAQSLPDKPSFLSLQDWNGGFYTVQNELYTTSSEIAVKPRSLTSPENPASIRHRQICKATVFDSQWLLVLFNFDGLEQGDLPVKAGSVIRTEQRLPPVSTVTDTSLPDQWLLCSDWNGHEGQVPSNYVRRIVHEEEFDNLLSKRPRARALYEFKAEADNDLPIKPGEELYLLERVNESWFRGESVGTGQRGIFPSMFVEVLMPL